MVLASLTPLDFVHTFTNHTVSALVKTLTFLMCVDAVASKPALSACLTLFLPPSEAPQKTRLISILLFICSMRFIQGPFLTLALSESHIVKGREGSTFRSA